MDMVILLVIFYLDPTSSIASFFKEKSHIYEQNYI